ncbi:MAG TPA: M20 family metallopeptidase [Bacteroidia bacterium]|nr:M20 family metallopeptidase [Bacteroidia bacterium]HNC33366.1 M20 family metallopeptidase [Bacteroidia bacterium]HND72617.1 M20 family metallopeptidase [Bacteroidia bacterium]HOM90384.1 M20 family metallopeptidase [Bacteroidia bacterium]HRF14901.1 M20 family metallopeptidase [Bacteroidia bacterium]
MKINKIKQLAEAAFNTVLADRRHLHKNPELSFKEFQTQQFVWGRLDEIGITNKVKIAETGIVAMIEGKNPSAKIIALRADMDALPIQETNKTDYVSQNAGVMHACGHDVHTSSLLGVASVLQQFKNEFSGTVKLLFQPGEEKLPGGASMMIKEGVLKNPSVSGILGQHVMPLIETGKVGFRSGVYMASTDEIYVTIKGKGGHGAIPHQNIDPVLIASHIIVALQQIVSRNANPIMPSVLSFGKVVANGATNVIPDSVYLEGTFRTLDERWRNDAHAKMIKMAEAIAQGMGGKCEFNIVRGYPALVNNPELTASARKNAVDYLGEENVLDLDIWMAAEDFAFYSQETNACFYRLGTRNEAKGITSSVHTSTFDIDENALKTGVGLMTYLALCELKQ